MFLLFGKFVAVVATALFVVLTSSVSVPILVLVPWVLRELMQVFWTFEWGTVWLKRTFRCRIDLYICSNIYFTLLYIVTEKKFWISRHIFFLLRVVDCLGSMQYNHANFAKFTGSVFTGLSSASESVQSWTIVLSVVVFKLLLFFTSNNVLVTLEIAPTASKRQPCIPIISYFLFPMVYCKFSRIFIKRALIVCFHQSQKTIVVPGGLLGFLQIRESF